MIVAKDVNFSYPDGTSALHDINLEIGNNDMAYIIGPSGSGKTTLLKLFMGIEFPTTGTLKVFNQPMVKGQNKKIKELRRYIGPVFQDFKLINGRSAMDNIILGMRFLNISPQVMKNNAKEALERVGLPHKKSTPVENLSFGERQRIAIARAVARKPILILADEPTGNLDKENAQNILRLLTSFKSKDTTVIITTHATHLINGEKDSILISIDKGRITVERLG
ncbi:MAG: ATP-binding cassette domain-containing protein [Firmicutes bacterium]|nr:ATP-binding cassette domain-containing protein [Bacillota bacterium]